jgi:hypothetical protein
VQAAPERYRRISEEVVERLERIPGRGATVKSCRNQVFQVHQE